MSISSIGNIASRTPLFSTQESSSVVVRPGDTLSGIAKRHHLTLENLLDANPHKRSNPNLVRPGEVINLPNNILPSSGQTQAAAVSESSMPNPRQISDIGTDPLSFLRNLPALFASHIPAGDRGTPKIIVVPHIYTVAPGDTISKIAQRAGVTEDALRSANGLHPADDRHLQVGKELRLPEGARAITSTQSSTTTSNLQDKAWQTALSYKQGNIAGLDEKHTLALIASTVATESNGGDLNAINSAGYIGRYQAGASWLAQAGLIEEGDQAVIKARKADGFTSDWSWAKSGGMTRFLQNKDNWVEGLSYEKYLASAEIQDKAFKTNSDKLYNTLKLHKYIDAKTTQAEIAGLLKAGHIGGPGGAIAVAQGGGGSADSNGTTPRKYYNDLVQRGEVYLKRSIPTPAQQASTEKQTPPAEQINGIHQPTPVVADKNTAVTGEHIATEAKSHLGKSAKSLMESAALPAMKDRDASSNCANFVSAVLVKLGILNADEHRLLVNDLKDVLINNKGWSKIDFKGSDSKINFANLKEGDVVFMQRAKPYVSHVEFIVKNDAGQLVAVGSNGTNTQRIYYHQNTWWQDNATTVLRQP